MKNDQLQRLSLQKHYQKIVTTFIKRSDTVRLPRETSLRLSRSRSGSVHFILNVFKKF